MRRLLILLAAAMATFPAFADAAPVVGRYVVAAARRDPAVTNPQAEYRPDDPQLVHRVVSFTPTGASFDGAAIACSHVQERTAPESADALFGRIFPERRKPGYRRHARPNDFGVTLPPKVQVTRFRCVSGERRGAAWNDAALFPVGRDAWGLKLVDDFLLVLISAPARVAPSFDCGRAGLSVAERTICADPVLAGWDLSVAQAYKESGTSVADQRAWLAERDRCGANAICLQDSMETRTTDLLPE